MLSNISTFDASKTEKVMSKASTKVLKSQIWVLSCTNGSGFPKSGGSLLSKDMTNRLDETIIFDGRDNPETKISYYNAVYKGIATFEQFKLY